MEKQNRKRNMQILFRVTPDEKALIYEKMRLCRMTNFEAHAREMATKGYIIVKDYAELKNLAAELQEITIAVKQILKQVDTMGLMYAADAERIRRKLDECWDMVRQLFREAMWT